MWLNALVVGCGGFIGAAARYLVTQFCTSISYAVAGQQAVRFPVGTFAVNLIGCLLMGFLACWLPQRFPDHAQLLVFATTGCLGGFTTFSTFGLDAYKLWVAGDMGLAAIYVAVTLALCLAGVALGVAAAKGLA